jgi:predicted O-methyltransferase YrrM
MLNNWLDGSRLADANVPTATDIHTHMTAGELRALYDLSSGLPNAGTALEIGSYLGASSCRIAAGLSVVNGHLYCVDTWANETMPEGERDTYAEFLTNIRGISDRVSPIRKRSDALTVKDIPVPLDLVFIDADHSYRSVKTDFERVCEWVRDGGTLAFHDTTYFEGVSRVVGEILATGQWQIGGNVDSLTWLKKIGKNGSFPNPMSPEEREFLS